MLNETLLVAASETCFHEYKVQLLCIMYMKFSKKMSNLVCFFTRIYVAIHAWIHLNIRNSLTLQKNCALQVDFSVY